MKHYYKTGFYAVFYPLLAGAAYLFCNQELPQVSNVNLISTVEQTLPAPAGTNALPGIEQQLAKQEYNISFDEQKSAMQSPNRQ